MVRAIVASHWMRGSSSRYGSRKAKAILSVTEVNPTSHQGSMAAVCFRPMQRSKTACTGRRLDSGYRRLRADQLTAGPRIDELCGRTPPAAGSPVEPRKQGDRETRGPALVAEVSAAEPDAASSVELARAERPHPQTAQAQIPRALRHMSGNQRLRRRGHRGVFELLRVQSSAPALKSRLPTGIDCPDAWS